MIVGHQHAEMSGLYQSDDLGCEKVTSEKLCKLYLVLFSKVWYYSNSTELMTGRYNDAGVLYESEDREYDHITSDPAGIDSGTC